MKTLIYIIVILISSVIFTNAQPPQAIPFQAVARDLNGDVIKNQNISLRFSILDATITGTVVYCETENTFTNALGLFTINIGQGNVVTGNFNSINWGNGSKFIQTEMDASGGTNYVDLGTQQMLSVPYALYAGKSSDSFTHFIGELYGGGIIFHLYKIAGVEHGLIVSLVNMLPQPSHWSNVTNIEIGLSAQNRWDGFANSNSILSQSGQTNSAAQLCLDYSVTDNTGTFDDWYLPSIDELGILFNQRFLIDKILQSNESFFGYAYWSSTELLSYNVYAFHFYEGTPFYSDKSADRLTRAIRAF